MLPCILIVKARFLPCIESVLWADEIIVLDSCSTDSTRDILAEYLCKVTVRPWLDYAAQKQFSLSRLEKGKCRSPWALLFYPPFVFLKMFFVKRQFVNGWAGCIGCVCMEFCAFMKDTKGYEHARQAALSDANLMAQMLAADEQPPSKLTPQSACNENPESEPDNDDQHCLTKTRSRYESDENHQWTLINTNDELRICVYSR